MTEMPILLPRQSADIKQLTCALTNAQLHIPIIGKNKAVSFSGTSYTYADLPSTIENIKTALNENGIAVMQGEGFMGDHVFLITTLQHVSGEWKESYWFVPQPVQEEIGKKSFSKVWNGNTTTARRYALQAAVCTATEDEDDDNSEPISVTSNEKYANQASGSATDKQVGMLKARCRNNPDVEKWILQTYGSYENIPFKAVNAILEKL